MNNFVSKKLIAGALFVLVLCGLLVWYAGPFQSVYAERISACEAAGDEEQQCYETLILDAAHEGGIDVAFDVLAQIYEKDQTFASYCHGNTHELGDIAYEDFSEGRDFTPSTKTSYCGFGFYHGFLEALLLETSDLSEARRFCTYLDEKLSPVLSGIAFACYHGIGHGVVDGTDPSKWGNAEAYIESGLAMCRRLSEVEEHKERCASGVYNALAVAYRNPKYKFNVDLKDIYTLCRAQRERYEREACHDQMNSYIVEESDSFKEALMIAATYASPEFTEVAVSTVAGYMAQNALARSPDLGSFVRDCSVLSLNLRDSCAHGFASGLLEFGKPGEEFEPAIEACAQGEDQRDACMRGVIMGGRDRLPVERRNLLCDSIDREVLELGKECREIINEPIILK